MPNNNYIITSSGSFVSKDEFYHWGVKGMKGGIRRQQLRKSPNVRMEIGLQFFANKASSRKTVKLSKKELAHVISELATNITDKQKTYPTVVKPIGHYVYVFENNFDGTYRVIGKKKKSRCDKFYNKRTW